MSIHNSVERLYLALNNAMTRRRHFVEVTTDDLIAVLNRYRASASDFNTDGELVLVCDRIPDAEGCTFIEIEDGNGTAVRAGEWRIRSDGNAELPLQVNAHSVHAHAEQKESITCLVSYGYKNGMGRCFEELSSLPTRTDIVDLEHQIEARLAIKDVAVLSFTRVAADVEPGAKADE